VGAEVRNKPRGWRRSGRNPADAGSLAHRDDDAIRDPSAPFIEDAHRRPIADTIGQLGQNEEE
jgi:hypothetical protein